MPCQAGTFLMSGAVGVYFALFLFATNMLVLSLSTSFGLVVLTEND